MPSLHHSLSRKLTPHHGSGGSRSRTWDTTSSESKLHTSVTISHPTLFSWVLTVNFFPGISVAAVPISTKMHLLWIHLLHWHPNWHIYLNWLHSEDDRNFAPLHRWRTKAECHRASQQWNWDSDLELWSPHGVLSTNACGWRRGKREEAVTVVLGGGRGEKKLPQVCLFTPPSKSGLCVSAQKQWNKLPLAAPGWGISVRRPACCDAWYSASGAG